MQLGLENRTIIVTGGASGIGAACVRLLREEGALAISWDIASTEPDSGSRPGAADYVHSLVVDITDRQSVERGIEKTRQLAAAADSSIYGLVHAAAIGSGHFGFPFTNVSHEAWRKVLDVNVMGMVQIAHAVTPLLTAENAGAMVFISSVAGQIGSQTDPPYSASKAANINFAQCMAKDLAANGIRVNSVCPGMVQTPLNRSVWQAWYDLQPSGEGKSYLQWAGEKVKAVVPLQRWQTPEAVANMVVFLLSDRASEVTGQTINVDGGFVMHW